MELGLSSPAAAVAPAPEPAPGKSAGTAWLLSLLLPGLGQLYCGKTRRGIFTLLFFAIGVAVSYAFYPPSTKSELIWGMALRLSVVLYIFAPLDAYFTAREIKANVDRWIDPNPRVAAVLNLTTRGFGYFYLGERTKGVVVWIVLGVVNQSVQKASGEAGLYLQLILEAVLIILAIHAYRLAKNQVDQALKVPLESQPILPVTEGLAPALPVCVAAVFVANYFALVAIGVMLPDYEKLDHSQVRVLEQAGGTKAVSDGKYNYRLVLPAGWKPAPEEEFLFAAEEEELGCSSAITASAVYPWQSTQAFSEALTSEVLKQNPNFRAQGIREGTLAGRKGHEAAFTALYEGVEVTQRYMSVRKGMSMYTLVTTFGTSLAHECGPGQSAIRSSLMLD